MRLTRVRFTMRRMMLALVVVGIALISTGRVWRMQGGTLPSLSGLRVGMSEARVTAIVGPPSSKGERPDGSSWLTITRPGSF
jgi:hypothetical protein